MLDYINEMETNTYFELRAPHVMQIKYNFSRNEEIEDSDNLL